MGNDSTLVSRKTKPNVPNKTPTKKRKNAVRHALRSHQFVHQISQSNQMITAAAGGMASGCLQTMSCYRRGHLGCMARRS
jgi:hypothetical protein